MGQGNGSLTNQARLCNRIAVAVVGTIELEATEGMCACEQKAAAAAIRGVLMGIGRELGISEAEIEEATLAFVDSKEPTKWVSENAT